MPPDHTLINAMSTSNENIQTCIEAVGRCLEDRFILIGGAAMQLLGSRRTTSDVDILVSANEDISSLVRLLTDQHGFSNVEGELRYGDGGTVT